jgi:catechol 2,3-dioxygenase-like lactoylglutathione lyase family enzyme
MFKPLLLGLLLAAPSARTQTPPRPAITGIAFMRVYTSNPAAAQHFYGDTLGFERAEVDGKWLYPVSHAQWIEVLPSAPPRPNERMAAIAFTTSDAAGLARYLQASKIDLAEPLRDGQFGVRDPEGNLVLFVQQGAKTGTAGMVARSPVSPHASSDRIIHVGFIVVSRERENAFWRDILGFRPYWVGGQHKDTDVDYVSLQVPDGQDWLEYMLSVKPDSNLHDHGMMDHFSLGIERMDSVVKSLARNHCEGPNCAKTQMGRDGKVQLNLFDPDQTRVEFMEFTPSGTICCSAFAGTHPTEAEAGK